jgi:F-box-like
MSSPQDSAITSDWRDGGPLTIGMLPDDVLLKIFAFYVDEAWEINGWHRLVHVCRKWRNTVFGSPYHLNLQLVYTEKTPMRKTLEVWPPLPIVIAGDYHSKSGKNTLMATLEYNDRVCEIKLWFISSSLWERVLAAMQVPFPRLTHLDFWFTDTPAPVVPDSFLGGSAPRLRKLALNGASFLGLSKLLLSTPYLVELNLRNIPHSGYISPEAIVDSLSALTRLKELELTFKSPRSRPNKGSRRPPLPTRTLLPSLTEFEFDGVSDYLEDFVARIDAPLLNRMTIEFFHRVKFDTPQLAQFISRIPHFRARDEARVLLSDDKVSITLPGPFDQGLDLEVRCGQLDLQVALVAQACSSSFPQALIATVERLYIWYWPDDRPDNIKNRKWLDLLRPFSTVKGLYLSRELVPCIAATLRRLTGERVTEVLPALQGLFVEGIHPSGSDEKAFKSFIAARQLSGHTIAISDWDGE